MTLTVVSGHNIALHAASNDPTPAQVAEFFLSEYRGATKSAYGEDLRQFFVFCSMISVNVLECRRPQIVAFIEQLRHQNASAATIKRKVSVLRSFYRYAVDEEYVEKSPVPSTDKRLHLVSVSRKSQTLGPDREELIALLKAAEDRSPRDYAILRTLIHQGLRVSELVNLDVSDMRLERGHRVFHLRRKGDMEQDMAVAPDAVSAIDTYLAGRVEGPLFANEDGSRMSRYQIDYLIDVLCSAAGVAKRLSPHSFRHACVTQLLDEEKPIRDVQVFMGHANSSTTERYDLGRRVVSDASPAYALRF